jgi:hypothetical protein
MRWRMPPVVGKEAFALSSSTIQTQRICGAEIIGLG